MIVKNQLMHDTEFRTTALQFFQAMIYGTLEQPESSLAGRAGESMDAIDERVNEFFVQSSHLYRYPDNQVS